MFLAVVSVSVADLARCSAAASRLVVLTAIPVTLALTLFVFYLYGYTLNRITLFALIFSIGILVDDAIVVVENIVRHARMSQRRPRASTAIAVRAVDEVGNPTILATLTVDRGDPADGVRRRPDGPLHAPDSGRRVGRDGLLAGRRVRRHAVGGGAAAAPAARRTSDEPRGSPDGALPPRDAAAASRGRPRARVSSALVAVLLVGAVALVPLGLVTVKMLPFDNKSELQVDRAHAGGHAARDDRAASRRRSPTRRCATRR